MAKSSIEKFISADIRNKKLSETKKGYEAWLRKNGIDPTAELSDSIGKAYAENEKSISHASSTAEALAESGLSKSGYAKYIKEATEERKAAKVGKTVQTYLAADQDNKAVYSDELDRLEAKRLAEEKKAEEERQKAEKKAEEEGKRRKRKKRKRGSGEETSQSGRRSQKAA